MAFSELEEKVLFSIDTWSNKIISIADTIWSTPELGYKEVLTSKLVCQVFDELQLHYEKELAVTGVKAFSKNKSGPRICIIAEMDAVVCYGHESSDPHTGAVHACGHHMQMASMLGAAIGLVKSGVLPQLCGDVCFFAVPAEEYIDLDYRRELKSNGIISYFGGKQELISKGMFDDIDIAIMIHAQGNTPTASVFLHGTSLGFVEKKISFHGKAAHASTPSDGVNALNAAALAILGIHANRETFREEDKIRIHPIITKGGDVVNSVPDEVCMDSYVRGRNFDAIMSASNVTNRVINSAASMVGAEAEISTQIGYLPLCQDRLLGELFKQVAGDIVTNDGIFEGIDMVGSSDIGDLSHLIPCIQPTVGGVVGGLHSKEFYVSDPIRAYIIPAKLLALTVVRLLSDDAKIAKEVISQFKPQLGKSEYLDKIKNM